MRYWLYILSYLASCGAFAQDADIPHSIGDTGANPPVSDPEPMASVIVDPIEMDELFVAEDVAPGLLVVVVDRNDILGSRAPVGRLGGPEEWREMRFNDSGIAPDGVEGDGQYVAWVALDRSRQVMGLEIFDVDENLVFSEEGVPVPSERELPRIAILLMEDGRHIPTYETHDFPEYDEEPVVHEWMISASSSSTVSENENDELPVSPNDVRQSNSSSGEGPSRFSGAYLPTFVLLLFSLAGLWWVRRTRFRFPNIVPVAEPETAFFADQSRSRIIRVSDDSQRLSELLVWARAASRGGRVLICPREQSRGFLQTELGGLGTVLWSRSVRPSPDDVRDMGRQLMGWGHPTVLIEGRDALQPAGSEEPMDAVVTELSRDLSDDFYLRVWQTDREVERVK